MNSLNPCSGGLWFLRNPNVIAVLNSALGLNPCSGGLWFLSWDKIGSEDLNRWGLNPCSGGLWFLRSGVEKYVFFLVHKS